MQARKQGWGAYEVRRREARKKGTFFPLRRLGREEIQKFFKGSSLVGVDGSVGTYGASFPYTVTFFRALARSTRADNTGEGRIWTHQLFSPLLPGHQAKVEEKLKAGLDPEEAVARLRWETLAVLEAEAGKQAVERECPRLLLWDGGFARLETHASLLWKSLKTRALRQGTVILGITEEIATSSLVQVLGNPEELEEKGMIADREILYGLLRPGEAFQREEDDKKKGRVYVRFARHPQIIAVDYLSSLCSDK